MRSSPELPPEVFCSLTRHCYSISLDFTSHTPLSNSKVKEQRALLFLEERAHFLCSDGACLI